MRVKRNVVDRLAKELPYAEGTIGIGTVTDPYQAAEGRFRLTRGCLEVLCDRGRKVHIHTKSPLVLRDLDLLSEMECVVGITVTTADDRISKMTEPGAPLPGERLEALTRLADSGVDSYALIAPVMSSLEGGEERLADALEATGVKVAVCDPLNLRLVDTTRLDRMGISPSQIAVDRLRGLLSERGMRPFRSLRQSGSVCFSTISS